MAMALCDMTLDELRDERRRLQKSYRRARPWSAELHTAKEELDACDAWIGRHTEQRETV
ncbi:hypothetical protein IB276_10925 [Ensifer sp. ENS04]|uniref:hypothetical protein n=1 Tax=Ensifer sp. ENS04 TaxID=2769281 RepID=UPI001783BF09|nr:hypothetical protein [Ensifer sp. ENS04]MBD9539964.1 hypothetical protein [Ensifer sp. ENS04]